MSLIASVSQEFTISARNDYIDLSTSHLTSAVKAIIVSFEFFVIYVTVIICL